jgi:chromatin structure-remodeling complex protein RSC7
MADADTEMADTTAVTDVVEADPEGEEYAEPEEEAPGEDEASAAEDSRPSTPLPVLPRKRGRPPKNRPPVPPPVDGEDDVDESEIGTPMKRKRGRPPASSKGRHNGQSLITKHVIDKLGTTVDVVDDEADLPEDEEGETKVDKSGNLQGGREYRCRTFTVLGRGNRLYMLSTEPARCIGFRDSYLFFQKHRLLYKIIIDEGEKYDLIDREIIPHSYKGRSIGIVTARSVFREFGARIIVGGKRIIDDYEVTKMKTDGFAEGELADPNDKLPKAGEPYDKNQYVAWHGASSVYHQNVPTVPMANVVDPKKRKITVTDTNWMLEHAREAR